MIDQKAIDTYMDILHYMKFKNISSIVTLFHFTVPQWFWDKGHFEERDNIVYFEKFCTLMIKTYGEIVDTWATMNEPQGMLMSM